MCTGGIHMECGICRHDNETDSKFCAECGALLAPCCPSCEAEQPAGAKFCNQCGSSMVAGVAPVPGAAPPAPTPTTAVRKSVTALFGDLVGSTSFGEQVDPEAARAALAPYFEILRSTIEDHAGTVAKFTGDGIMAIFGIPEVAEDDALRAVAAGLEIQRRFRAFAESVRDRHGVVLGMRVGINTGELVISDADEDLVGDVLNTAARLEASCQPGRVTVGEDTWRLTRSSITYEVLGEVRVKGKADPLATFQVVDTGLKTVEENTPFVGRAVELADVRAAFDDAMASSTCRLVTVVGAPGVGKTRLASELRSRVEARSFDLRFERRGSTTFTPIVELLDELTGSSSPADIARLVGGHSEADRLAGALSSFLGDGESRSTEESFWAVRRLLEHLALDEPVVIVVDDIQWAEPLFWDLLDHLAEWVSAPVMLLALARPELRELRPELTQPGRRVAASVSLEGLDADTTRELAARLLDTDELPADLVERIPDSTEGNPLFVRELVQMLVDDGVLARTGDRWHLTIDVDAIEVPPTILSLLASRVERLPDDERQVVELASVIGTEFDRGVLGSIAGDDITARLGALIDRLRRKDLVEPSGTWAGDHPEYRFHHVLVRDAAYRRLLKGHRADLHERVGRHLERLGASGGQADVVIAHHYEQVHRYRSELGTVDGATRLLAAQATQRLRAAAEQALAREDLASAGGYTIRALRLAADGDERSELLVLGCEALLSSGDVARGAPLVDELLARDLDERLAAWADCFRAQLWSLTDSDRLREASVLTAESADRLESLGDPAGVAKARLVRALILARLGRVGDCEAELDLALGAARTAGDRRRTVAVLGAAPLAALWGPSPVARAGGRCLDVLRLLRITTTSPAVEATSIRCQGMLEALRGKFDSARDKFEISRTTARDLGLRHGLYETELFEGFVELLAGNPVAAEPHLTLARAGLGALGIGADAGQAGALLARSVLQQGRVHEADELAIDALASAGQNLQTAIASRSVLAEIRAAQGRHDEARQYAGEAIEIAERTDAVLDHAMALQAAARVARRAGDTEAAARFETAVQRLFDDKGVTMGGEPSAAGGRSSSTDEPTVSAPVEDGSEEPGTASTALIAPNAAWEVNELLWSAWVDDDRAGYQALLAPDFLAQIHELGPKLAFSGDRVATTEVLFDMLADERANAIPNRLVAVRGDDLALIEMVVRDGGSTSTMYTVSQVRDGRAVRADTFAEDQLGDALDHLDREYLVGLGFAPDHWLVRNSALAYERRAEGWTPVLHPEFEYTEHRRLHHRDGDVDADLLTEIGDALEDATSTMIPRVFGVCDRAALFERVESAGVAIDHVGVFIVLGFTDDHVRSAEIFDFGDLDAALARYDELAAEAPDAGRAEAVTNAAWQQALAALRLLETDEDRLVERIGFHHDFRATPAERLTVGIPDLDADELVRRIREFVHESELSSSRHDPVAVHGDALCLARSEYRFGDDQIVRYTVVEVDDGLITRLVTFDEAQLVEALDTFARRAVERGRPTRLGDMEITFRDAHWRHDVDTFDRALDPAWHIHDHRRRGLGEMTRVEYLASFSAQPGQALYWTVEVLAHTDSVVLTHDRWLIVDGSGWDQLHIGVLRSGSLLSSDTFDPSDLAAARRRYDELVARSSAEEEWNSAATIATRTASLVARDGFDIHRELFAPGYADEHRGMHSWTDRGDADPTGESMTWMRQQGSTDVEIETIAARGAALCLQRWLRKFDSGDETERLVLTHLDGHDRVAVSISYDPEQIVEAHLEIDRRWLDELGLPADHVARRRLEDAYTTDPERAVATFHPELQFVNHRRLAYESGDGSALSNVLHSTYFEMIVRMPRVHRLSELGAVVERVETAVDEVGENRMIIVVIWEDELIRNLEGFDVDHLDRALARYDQLVSSQKLIDEVERRQAVPAERTESPVESMTSAWHRVLRFRDAWNANDRDRCLAVLGDGATFEGRQRGHTGIVYGAEQIVDLLLDPQLFGDASSREFRLIAARGDHLCLCQIDEHIGGVETRALHLIDDGRDSHGLRLFRYDVDQLAEATAELDRLHAEARSNTPRFTNAAWERHLRFRAAWLARDRELCRTILGDEFEVVPMQPFSTGVSFGRDEFLGLIFDHDDLELVAENVVDTLVAIRGDDLCLYRNDENAAGGTGIRHWLNDKASSRLYGFDGTQLIEAQVMLDHLWFDSLGFADDHPWRTFGPSAYAVDPEAAVATTHPDVAYREHRRLSYEGGGREQLTTNLSSLPLIDHITMPVIHRISDDAVLFQRDELDADGAASSMLIVTTLSDGLVASFDIFDSDDLGAAIARYDECAAT